MLLKDALFVLILSCVANSSALVRFRVYELLLSSTLVSGMPVILPVRRFGSLASV